MASQALYRKWRSKTFEELIGQQHVTQTLRNALQLNRVAHAYLFAGPRGTGKTSAARLLAKAVNCLAEEMAERPCNRCAICTAINEGRLLDLIEIDAASNTGVDDIRDLREKVGFRPGEARIKFYIIDEVHMLSNSAFNALLKTLEEPPEHVIFVLATTEPQSIPATITSRCQRFDFKRIRLADIVDRLAYIAAEEGLSVEKEALTYIARQGAGSMRDAISLLDQLMAYGSDEISLELVRTMLGAVTPESVAALVEAIVDQEVAAGLDVINRVVGDGMDPRRFTHEVVEYLRGLMLVKLGDGSGLLNLPEETLERMKAQAKRADRARLVRATMLFNSALVDIKRGLLDIPQLPLELAFVETIESAPAETVAPAETAAAKPASSATPKPPTPAPAPSRPVPKPAPSDEITIDQVKGCMEQVYKEVEGKNKIMAEALRNQARVHQVTGREIQFVTRARLKQRFEKPQPQAALDAAFSRIMGQPVKVRFLSEEEIPGATDPIEEEDDTEQIEALVKTAEELGGAKRE